MVNEKIAIIIPAFNEARVLAQTLQEIKLALKKIAIPSVIVVIDDGSQDETTVIARSIAGVVITHKHNCGLGAALNTGLTYAKRQNFAYAITYDADGQHTPSDLVNCYQKLKQGYDLVIGSRFMGSHESMPKFRRYVLAFSNVITYVFFGIWTSDSQSGFRGLSKVAISGLHLLSNRMEVSSEFFAEVKRLKLNFTEIPIHIRYTKYSLEKGQGNTAGFSVLLKLLYLLGR